MPAMSRGATSNGPSTVSLNRCTSGRASQATPTPRTEPSTTAAVPSTTPLASTTRRRCGGSAPLAAIRARARCCRRAPTAKAGPASSTTSSSAIATTSASTATMAPSLPPSYGLHGHLGRRRRVLDDRPGQDAHALGVQRPDGRPSRRRPAATTSQSTLPLDRLGGRVEAQRGHRPATRLRPRVVVDSTVPTTSSARAVGQGQGRADREAAAGQPAADDDLVGAAGVAAVAQVEQPAGHRVLQVDADRGRPGQADVGAHRHPRRSPAPAPGCRSPRTERHRRGACAGRAARRRARPGGRPGRRHVRRLVDRRRAPGRR